QLALDDELPNARCAGWRRGVPAVVVDDLLEHAAQELAATSDPKLPLNEPRAQYTEENDQHHPEEPDARSHLHRQLRCVHAEGGQRNLARVLARPGLLRERHVCKDAPGVLTVGPQAV